MKRTIKQVLDLRNKRALEAALFLDGLSEMETSIQRREIRDSHAQGQDLYLCLLCNQPVYMAGDKSGRGCFFKHYKSEGDCLWRTEDPESLDTIAGRKFGGVQEGERHRFLKNLIANSLAMDDRFSNVLNDRFMLSEKSGDRRRPDVRATYQGKPVVFEIQLATVPLPVIADRESFYQAENAHVVWVFDNFEGYRHLRTAKDIYDLNRGNAFELDVEAIARFRLTGRFHLKAWWNSPSLANNQIQYEWRSEIVDIGRLHFNDGDIQPYFRNALADEARILAEQHRDFLSKFEAFWLSQKQYKPLEAAEARKRGFERLKTIGNTCHTYDWDMAVEHRFDDVLTYLYCLRDGTSKGGKTNLVHAINVVLENWPSFTDAVVAVCKGYGRETTLNFDSVKTKIARNKARAQERDIQFLPRHEYNPIIRVLFPEVAEYLSN